MTDKQLYNILSTSRCPEVSKILMTISSNFL